jgi:hypothetical protein
MSGFWAVFWLMVAMKLPIAALFYIVWWALRDPPVPEADVDEGGGGTKRDPHPRIHPPHPPRRGPHADPAPRPPERVRATRRGRRAPERI